MNADLPDGVVLETPRLVLRRFTPADARLMLEVLIDPDFVRFVGDRGVRTVDEASSYLERGTLPSYQQFGFGMYVVMTRNAETAGICGLVKRDALEDVDIGFAFLPSFRARGYATESAAAVMEHARSLGLRRLAAIVHPANAGSIRVLEKLGMVFKRPIRLSPEDHEIRFFARDL